MEEVTFLVLANCRQVSTGSYCAYLVPSNHGIAVVWVVGSVFSVNARRRVSNGAEAITAETTHALFQISSFSKSSLQSTSLALWISDGLSTGPSRVGYD
jgi:hypothetical protein